jgi:hypothetical protein
MKNNNFEDNKKARIIGALFYLFIIIMILFILIINNPKAHAEFTEEQYQYRILYNIAPTIDNQEKSLFENCESQYQYVLCISYDWTGEICRTKIYNENLILTECLEEKNNEN